MLTSIPRGVKKSRTSRRHLEILSLPFLQPNFTMAGFNRFGSGGFGSLYGGMGSLQQPSAVNRREDRFDNRRNSSRDNFERRERDFAGRRDPSPRRRRYSPDPPYSGLRGSRQDDRGGLGGYSMDDLGRDNFTRNRGGQRSNDRDLMRDGHNIRPPNRGGDGILGAKPGDMPRDLTPNPSSGLTSQLAQQQQQLMAMVQTQSLLAAIQAQASATKRGGRQPPSLLQGARMNDNRGRMGDRNNRKRRMSPPRGGPRNMNQFNQRQRRTQQYRNMQGNRPSYQQRRDYDRDKKRVSVSSQKSDDNEPVEEPYVEEKIEEEEEEEKEKTPEEKTTKEEEDKEAPKKVDAIEKPTKSEEPKPESRADEDQEYQSETNLAGQNINSLVRSLYDNSRRKYVCKVCKIMCTKESCFRQHLYGKRHVKTWLESRGQSFEAEMFRRASEEAAKSLAAKEQAKKPKEKEPEKPEQATEVKQEPNEDEQPETVEVKKEEESSPPASSSVEETKVVKEEPTEVKNEKTTPSEPKKPLETVKVKEEKVPVKEEKFEAKYSCDNRKVAVKEGEYITISSITEARVRLKGFDRGINTQGCEFVKAVSGFNCRLCKTFILHGNDVMKHIAARKHQAKYRRYISEHPKYESNQLVRNRELSEMLSEREGDEVLLYEVIEDEEAKRPHRHGSGEVLEVEVTKYVAAEEEPDDNLLDEQDESREDSVREDLESSVSSDKKDRQDDILSAKGGDGTDQGHDVEMDGEDTLEEKYDPDLEKTLDETMEEKVDAKSTETKEDPNATAESSESQEDEQEEPVQKKPKVATTAGRRGRKAARGGAQASGRGRGRGAKRATRQKATPKPEQASADEKHDDDFMQGFQVIDEVADDE